MKYKNIVFLFCVTLPISLILRFLQLGFTTEITTGFFVKGYELEGKAMLYLIFALCLLPAVFSFFSHRSPENPPKPNVFLSIASAFFGGVTLLQVFFEPFLETVPAWQVTGLKLCAVLCAAFFLAFAAQIFIKIELPKIFTAIPVVYFLFRIVCDFTSTADLALISDNLLLISAYCAVLLFMLQFAKLYNEMDTELNFRKLMAFGFCAVSLCFTQSIPHFVMSIYTENNYLHTPLIENISLFFAGVFILTFLFSHFSHSNSCEN